MPAAQHPGYFATIASAGPRAPGIGRAYPEGDAPALTTTGTSRRWLRPSNADAHRARARWMGSARASATIDSRAARYQWIRTVAMLVSIVDTLPLSDAERERLLAPLEKSLEDAARNRGGGEPGDEPTEDVGDNIGDDVGDIGDEPIDDIDEGLPTDDEDEDGEVTAPDGGHGQGDSGVEPAPGDDAPARTAARPRLRSRAWAGRDSTARRPTDP